MSHKTKTFMGKDNVFSVTDRVNELTASMVVVLGGGSGDDENNYNNNKKKYILHILGHIQITKKTWGIISHHKKIKWESPEHLLNYYDFLLGRLPAIITIPTECGSPIYY